MAGTENIVETQIATHSKNTARKLVIAVFEMLSEIKDNVSAEAILRGFQSSLTDLANEAKREGKVGEEILGGYIKSGKIVKADKSPVSRVVDKILKEENVFYSSQNFVNKEGTKVNPKLEMYYTNTIKTALHKCKKLKSADVLIAMHFLTRECQDLAVLRLQILRGMFDELSKPNGFIKGGPDNQNGNEDSEKDKRNKHLGLLATAKVRYAAKIACENLTRLMNSVKWLRKEDPKWLLKQHNELPPKTENGVKDQPETDRAEAIEMYQEDIEMERKENIRAKYLHTNDQEKTPKEALSPGLKPRDEDKGKYKTREMASDEELIAFLQTSGSVIRFIDLKSCTNDDEKFKQALSRTYKINGAEVSLRKILNKLADTVYQKNTLIEVVKKLPGDPNALDSLLTLVEEKLKRSYARDKNRVDLNKKLSGWVAIINVVYACAKGVEVQYDPNTTHEQMLKTVPNVLKDITIKMVAENGEKLEDKTINDAVETEIKVAELPDLNPEHEKRLDKLGIKYNANIKYKERYTKICTFIKQQTDDNLKAANITIVTNGGKAITQDNWEKSNTFDKFVEGTGKNLKGIAVEYASQPKLPPLKGEARDARLVLLKGDNAYAKFGAEDSWLKDPTQEACENAVKDLTVEDYLGTNKDLLTALKDASGEKYVLAIKLADFVESWIEEAEKKLVGLAKDTNYVENNDEAISLKNEGWPKICAKISSDNNGYDVEVVNAFVDFVTKNSSEEFCKVEGIENEVWGKLMNGTYSLLVKPKSANQKLTSENNQFQLGEKDKEDEVFDENVEKPHEEKEDKEDPEK